VQQSFSGSCWAFCVCAWIHKICFQASNIYSRTEVFTLTSKDNLQRQSLCMSNQLCTFNSVTHDCAFGHHPVRGQAKSAHWRVITPHRHRPSGLGPGRSAFAPAHELNPHVQRHSCACTFLLLSTCGISAHIKSSKAFDLLGLASVTTACRPSRFAATVLNLLRWLQSMLP